MLYLLDNIASMHCDIYVMLPLRHGMRCVRGREFAPKVRAHPPASSILNITCEDKDKELPLAILGPHELLKVGHGSSRIPLQDQLVESWESHALQ